MEKKVNNSTSCQTANFHVSLTAARPADVWNVALHQARSPCSLIFLLWTPSIMSQLQKQLFHLHMLGIRREDLQLRRTLLSC